MVDYDPANQNTLAAGRLPTKGGKPTISDLKAAVRASSVSARYSEREMYQMTKNDIIAVCRQHNIAVPGLPGV